MKDRYIVIDNKKNMKYSYAKWQWNAAFGIVFISGIGTGILLFYCFGL